MTKVQRQIPNNYFSWFSTRSFNTKSNEELIASRRTKTHAQSNMLFTKNKQYSNMVIILISLNLQIFLVWLQSITLIYKAYINCLHKNIPQALGMTISKIERTLTKKMGFSTQNIRKINRFIPTGHVYNSRYIFYDIIWNNTQSEFSVHQNKLSVSIQVIEIYRNI